MFILKLPFLWTSSGKDCYGPEALVSLTWQCPSVQHVYTQGFGQHSNRKLCFRGVSVKASGKTSLNREQNTELVLWSSKRIHEAREMHAPRLQALLPFPCILDAPSCGLHCCHCTLTARAKVSLCESLPRKFIWVSGFNMYSPTGVSFCDPPSKIVNVNISLRRFSSKELKLRSRLLKIPQANQTQHFPNWAH